MKNSYTVFERECWPFLRVTAVVVIACISACSCNSLDQDWRSANEQNTKASYEAFLTKYPRSTYAAEAGERLEKISFDAAKAAHSTEALQSYLARYPRGAHAVEAGESLERISFDAAKAAHSIEAMQSYLARYPRGAHAADANSAIAALTPIRGRMYMLLIDRGVDNRGYSRGARVVYLETLDKGRKYEIEVTPDTKYIGGDPEKLKLGDVYDVVGPIAKAKPDDGKAHLESDIEIITATSVALIESPPGWHAPPAPPDPLESADILEREPQTAKAKVKHILLGWTEVHVNDPRGKKRDRATLEKLVKSTVAKLMGGGKIEPLMAAVSEDPGSARTGISYDVTPDAGLMPPFANLSLRLKVGEVGVVKTTFGIHIIQRVE